MSSWHNIQENELWTYQMLPVINNLHLNCIFLQVQNAEQPSLPKWKTCRRTAYILNNTHHSVKFNQARLQ